MKIGNFEEKKGNEIECIEREQELNNLKARKKGSKIESVKKYF